LLCNAHVENINIQNIIYEFFFYLEIDRNNDLS
jgi:hypothetical protein